MDAWAEKTIKIRQKLSEVVLSKINISSFQKDSLCVFNCEIKNQRIKEIKYKKKQKGCIQARLL